MATRSAAQLAMALCLQQLGKEVAAWNEDGMLDKFRYLPHAELVTTPAGRAAGIRRRRRARHRGEGPRRALPRPR